MQRIILVHWTHLHRSRTTSRTTWLFASYENISLTSRIFNNYKYRKLRMKCTIKFNHKIHSDWPLMVWRTWNPLSIKSINEIDMWIATFRAIAFSSISMSNIQCANTPFQWELKFIWNSLRCVESLHFFYIKSSIKCNEKI